MAAPHTQLTAEFPELSHLSREDLEQMLADPAYFQAIFHSLERVKALYTAQAELGTANEHIAQNNLASQDRLYQTRAETQAAFDEAKSLEARWREADREQRELSQRFSPQFLLMRLRHATTAQDDLSEARAAAFAQASESVEPGVAGGREVDDFVREFKDLRKTYHKRAIWGERWAGGRVEWPED